MDIASIIGALAGLAALVKVLYDSRNLRPNIAKVYEEMATKQADQINELRDRVGRLEAISRDQAEYIDELLNGIKSLIEQLECNHIIPRWYPRKRESSTLPKDRL